MSVKTLIPIGLIVVGSAVPAWANGGPPCPSIDAAKITTTPARLTISGNSFGAATPLVALDGVWLAVVSHTPTTVVVPVPSFIAGSPGTYDMAS